MFVLFLILLQSLLSLNLKYNRDITTPELYSVDVRSDNVCSILDTATESALTEPKIQQKYVNMRTVFCRCEV